MTREDILATVKELPSETTVKAWIFEANSEFFHVATYTLYRRASKTSIWKSNKKGKRISSEPIFHFEGTDHVKCINEYLDHQEKVNALEKQDSLPS